MPKWSFAHEGITLTAHADTTAMTSGGFMALKGGSATQRIDVYEVYLGGLAAASAPTPALLGRSSTLGGTPTAITAPGSNEALDPATAALAAPQVAYFAASTGPQRSTTLAKLALGFNAFGGLVRWVAAPGGEFKMLGNTASLGEINIGAFTGGTPGLMNAHIHYETY